MSKLLTINIVTADRSCLGLCLNRLKVLPSIELVDVHVFDNSKTSIGDLNKKLTESYGFTYYHFDDFITCRNKSVELTKTEYFTILDDDDWLVTDAIDNALYYMKKYPEIEYFAFNTGKQGRVDKHDFKEHIIDNRLKKLYYLNNFDNYESDRTHKVYLWNSASIIKTYLAQSCQKWEFIGCDDILPITSIYLTARKIMKVNRLMVQYPVQQSITANKDMAKLLELSDNMFKSYQRLLKLYPNKWDQRIIKKAIRNSSRQLQVIDNYTASCLIQLMK